LVTHCPFPHAQGGDGFFFFAPVAGHNLSVPEFGGSPPNAFFWFLLFCRPQTHEKDPMILFFLLFPSSGHRNGRGSSGRLSVTARLAWATSSFFFPDAFAKGLGGQRKNVGLTPRSSVRIGGEFEHTSTSEAPFFGVPVPVFSRFVWPPSLLSPRVSPPPLRSFSPPRGGERRPG